MRREVKRVPQKDKTKNTVENPLAGVLKAQELLEHQMMVVRLTTPTQVITFERPENPVVNVTLRVATVIGAPPSTNLIIEFPGMFNDVKTIMPDATRRVGIPITTAGVSGRFEYSPPKFIGTGIGVNNHTTVTVTQWDGSVPSFTEILLEFDIICKRHPFNAPNLTEVTQYNRF
jgi:hypothetical protein